MDIVFFIYTLAFLALGLTVVLLNEPGSRLGAALPFRWLAAFAFAHGAREALDLWTLTHGDAAPLLTAKAALSLMSFLLLMEFGRRLILSSWVVDQLPYRWSRLFTPWLHLPLLLGVFACAVRTPYPLAATMLWSRHLIGFPGAMAAAVGCYQFGQNRLGRDSGESDFPGQHLAWTGAALAFGLYGIFAGLIGEHFVWLPDAGFSEDGFRELVGLPVQLLRAACAVLIAVAAGYLLKIFRLDNERQLQFAQTLAETSIAELRKTQHRYELLFNSVADGVIGLDTDGNTMFANRAALFALGYSAQELVGQNFHALCHRTGNGQDMPRDDCRIIDTMRKQVTHHAKDDCFWRKNGTPVRVRYRATPVQEGGKTVGALVTFTEID